MSTLSTLPPIEHALVTRHLKRLRRIGHLQDRREHLDFIERTEGMERRAVVERCFAEDWEERKATTGATS